MYIACMLHVCCVHPAASQFPGYSRNGNDSTALQRIGGPYSWTHLAEPADGRYLGTLRALAKKLEMGIAATMLQVIENENFAASFGSKWYLIRVSSHKVHFLGLTRQTPTRRVLGEVHPVTVSQ